MSRSEVTAHLAAVSKLIAATAGEAATEMPGYYLDIIATYDRCRGLYDAVRTLLTSGFTHEAVALVGPLFLDSLVLAELAGADARGRARLVIGMQLQGLVDAGVALRAGVPPERSADIEEALSTRHAALIGAARALGVDAEAWSPRDEVQLLARRHGRGDEYADKLLSDQFIYGSSLAISQRYSSTDETQEVLVGGPHAQLDEWSDGTALFAAGSMVRATRAACSIFGWSEPPQLAALLDKTERLKDHLLGVQEPTDGALLDADASLLDEYEETQTRCVVVVMSAQSDALWRDTDPPLVIEQFPTAVGRVMLTYRTAFIDEGFESTVPREMWIEASGEESTTTFVEVITAYTNAAASFIPVIAFCTNAYVGDVQPKIAFDNAPGKAVRDYFQSFVPEHRTSIPLPGRRVPTESVVAVLRAVQASSHAARLRRAIVHYALALSHWHSGQETLALAFLYIGTETLVPVALKRECARLSITADELMASWGITDRRVAVRRNELNGMVRQRLLFRGNSALAAQAKRASDGFEHGFLDFGDVRTLAEGARNETGRLLREAILECADVPAEHSEKLLAEPYDIALQSFVTRYIWGSILGEGDDLAAPENAYPTLEWRSKLKKYKRNDDGTVTLTPEETPTVRLADGLAFRPRRYEAWGPEGIKRVDPPDPSAATDDADASLR